MKVFALTVLLSSTQAQSAANFQPIELNNKCGHAKSNCKAGTVCAGPFSSGAEWDWYERNYINDDDDDDWDSEWYDPIEDVRFWDYEAGNGYQSPEES